MARYTLRRKLLFLQSLLTLLTLLTGTSSGFAPTDVLEKDSPLLKKMGFELRSKWEESRELVMCEVVIDPQYKSRVWRSQVSLVVTNEIGLVTFQSDHSLATYSSYITRNPDSGGGKKETGFRFYLKPEYAKHAYLKFSLLGDKDQYVGDTVLWLDKFLPDYPPIEEVKPPIIEPATDQPPIEAPAKDQKPPNPHPDPQTDPARRSCDIHRKSSGRCDTAAHQEV